MESSAHLREDRRHIQDRDLRLLREVVQTQFNLEMAATDEMIRIALATKPDIVTLVPEKREELTTEGGLDVVKFFRPLKKAIQTAPKGRHPRQPFRRSHRAIRSKLRKAQEQMRSKFTQAITVTQRPLPRTDEELKKILDAVGEASHRNLRIAAGHGLNYVNVRRIAEITEIEELNIGHSIIARAVLVGLDRAVREMIALIK